MEKKKIGEKEPYEIQRLPDRDDAAYDEAGHIVVAYVLGRDIYGVRFQRNSKGTNNRYTDYRNPCLPPHIDSHVPYEHMKIPRPDGVSGTRVISAAGKAAVTLLCQQMRVSERLATYGMSDAKGILRSVRREGLPPDERKKRFRDSENSALTILCWPSCKASLEQIANFLRTEMQRASRDNLDVFSIEGAQLQAIISEVFT
jgi:hypothetical protein